MRCIKGLLPILAILAVQVVAAQNCLSTGLNGTVVNLPCNMTCSPFSFKVPHLKSTAEYTVVTIPYTPFPFIVNPSAGTGGEVAEVYIDDEFSSALTLPFPICFYDSTFTQFVIGSNGVVTFDMSNANCSNAWKLENGSPVPIPFVGGSSCNDGSGPKYPKYSIMSPYHDINPNVVISTPNRKIEWRYEGTAPCRKLVVSFFEIALFGDDNQLNTHQIVIHESTGLVDVFIKDKTLDAGAFPWNDNLAILGVQKDQTKALAAPGKNATVWEEHNTGYRFIPSGAGSRFVKSELYSITGTLLATTGITAGADTSTTTAGLLDINFPPQCPTANSTKYVVKTFYSSCSDVSIPIVVSDTVTINKTTSLNATAAQTPSACGPNGSITVNVPPGAGTLPYSMSIDGNTPVSVSGQTHTFSGLLGGAHSIVVTTAGGCSQTLNINVASSGTLTVNSAVTPVTCLNGNNAVVVINPQNGVAPFTYNINNGAFGTSNTFTNLPPGNYIFGIRDNSGCQLLGYPVTIAQGAPITASIVPNPTSCNGAANGSLTINPTSGTPPYQYSINNGAFGTSNVFSNLPQGTYFINVKDAIGCITGNLSTAVTAGNGLTATAAAIGTSCTGASNGTINITPTAGSGPYQYSLDGVNYLPGTQIANLAAGTYTVRIKDNAGCISNPITVTVAQGNALLASVSSTVASCAGVNNGSITVSPTNGSAPFTYKLDGGTPQGSNVFTNVSSGNHTIIVTDGAGCVSASIPVTVGVGAAITGTTATTPTSCNGAVNGTVSITPTSGATPYQYAIDGSGVFQAANSFTGLPAGPHSVIIRDASGCTSAPISFTIAAGGALTGTATATATSCAGAADGVITAQANNGNPPYQYALDAGIYQASASFQNLAPGAHTITIKDGAGCVSAPIPVTVTAGAQLTASVGTIGTSCSGATNGTITVTPTNSSGTYQYSLDGINFQSSNVFTGLASGIYTVTFKNNAGCQSAINANVLSGQPLNATTAVTNVLCTGESNGSVTVTVSTVNGTAPFQYSLDGINWQASNTFTGLAAGFYTVQFKDNNNCPGARSFSITEPAPLTIAPSEQAALCNGQSNGSIFIAASGGTAPYRYSINGTVYQSSNTFTVPAGSYTVYVKDNNNCIRSQVVNITQPQLLTASVTASNASCTGNDGLITMNASGGAGNFQYSIDGQNYQTSNIFYKNPGTYTITVKDLNGCTATGSATVGLTDNLTVSPMTNPTICEGTGIVLTPSTNATQYSWSPAIGLSSVTAAQPSASPTTTTTYTLTAGLGICSTTSTVTVHVNPAPQPDAGADGNICFGQTYQLQGSGGVQYQWTPSTHLDAANIYNPVVTPQQTIQYSLHVWDANGCKSLQPSVVQVNVTPPIVINISNDTAVAMGDIIQLFASSVATDYLWTPSFGLDSADIPDPLATVSGDITYTVLATTSAGCKGEASVTLKVYEGPEIYVPSAFTPNGDGRNDIFRPFPVGIKSYTYFKVFNRWGQQVYSTVTFNQGWDGKINGKLQPTGTYVWVVEGITKDGRKINKRGTVTLIR